MMRYLHNCWYMAGWADELSLSGVFSRRILDVELVFFRDEHNRVHALRDRCPHRFAPLSKGRLEKNRLVCGYHGLAFDGTGACVANPHGPVTRALSVPSYPAHEAFRALWIWMGESSKADPTLLPNLRFIDEAPETAFSKGYVAGTGHYQLWVDNILDLSHADYLHPTTLGGGAITRAKARVNDEGGKISVKWHCINEDPSPVQRALGSRGGKIDAWVEVEWSAPAVMTLRSASVPTGTPREHAGNIMNLHIMTPESDTKTHYFFAATRDFAIDNAELNARFAETRREIFKGEDEPMIAAQHKSMEGADFWSLQPVLLRVDEGAVRVRRRVDQLIAEEEQQDGAMRLSQ